MDVIFDTNPYRSLAAGRTYGEMLDLVRAIRQAEHRLGIIAWAAPTVRLELFDHLSGAADSQHIECMRAIAASYAHTRAFGCGRSYCLAPSADAVAAEMLFDFKDADEGEMLKALDRLAGVVYFDPDAEVVHQNSEQLQMYSTLCRNEERGFMERLMKVVVLYKKRYKGREEIAMKMRDEGALRKMYKDFALLQGARIGVDAGKLTKAKITSLTDQIAEFFPAPFELYLAIVAILVGNPELDIFKKNRRHWFWDYQMLFYVSRSTMTLVTEDRDMKSAAVAAGIGDMVKSLKEYCSELGIVMR